MGTVTLCIMHTKRGCALYTARYGSSGKLAEDDFPGCILAAEIVAPLLPPLFSKYSFPLLIASPLWCPSGNWNLMKRKKLQMRLKH